MVPWVKNDENQRKEENKEGKDKEQLKTPEFPFSKKIGIKFKVLGIDDAKITSDAAFRGAVEKRAAEAFGIHTGWFSTPE